jgi:hypothetical protein
MPKYRGAAIDSSAASKSNLPDSNIGGANFSRPKVRSASLGRAIGGRSRIPLKSLTTGPSSRSSALLSPAKRREKVMRFREGQIGGQVGEQFGKESFQR